jgi:hypothetical protein
MSLNDILGFFIKGIGSAKTGTRIFGGLKMTACKNWRAILSLVMMRSTLVPIPQSERSDGYELRKFG